MRAAGEISHSFRQLPSEVSGKVAELVLVLPGQLVDEQITSQQRKLHTVELGS